MPLKKAKGKTKRMREVEAAVGREIREWLLEQLLAGLAPYDIVRLLADEHDISTTGTTIYTWIHRLGIGIGTSIRNNRAGGGTGKTHIVGEL